MDKINFNRERARSKNNSPFWNPSKDVESIVEAIDEPRRLEKTGKMKRDAWLLDVNIIYGRDYEDGKEIELTGENRSLVLNSKTVIESKIKKLIEQYKTLRGRKIVLLGLGEAEGESGKYIDFYLDLEENARRDKVIS